MHLFSGYVSGSTLFNGDVTLKAAGCALDPSFLNEIFLPILPKLPTWVKSRALHFIDHFATVGKKFLSENYFISIS